MDRSACAGAQKKCKGTGIGRAVHCRFHRCILHQHFLCANSGDYGCTLLVAIHMGFRLLDWRHCRSLSIRKDGPFPNPYEPHRAGAGCAGTEYCRNRTHEPPGLALAINAVSGSLQCFLGIELHLFAPAYGAGGVPWKNIRHPAVFISAATMLVIPLLSFAMNGNVSLSSLLAGVICLGVASVVLLYLSPLLSRPLSHSGSIAGEQEVS